MQDRAKESSGSGDGRRRLLDTAERLLDEHGIDAISARAITAAAGHRNAAAVNYHFGDRERLVAAVITRRAEALDEQRHALLDELEAAGTVEPRAAAAAIIAPLADLLDEETGRRYLRLLNQASTHPAFVSHANVHFATSITRGVVHLQPLLEHLSPERRAARGAVVLGAALRALSDQARIIDLADPPRPVLDTPTFTDDLLDALLAALSA
jgi:AcrR family transcriptional regulator